MNESADYGARAHRAAERRVELAFLLMAAGEGDDDIEPGLLAEAEDEPYAGPFCGCLTCVIREALDAALPEMALLVAFNPYMN